VVNAPDMQKRLRDLGAEPETGGADAYNRFAREEAGKWSALIRKLGLAAP